MHLIVLNEKSFYVTFLFFKPFIMKLKLNLRFLFKLYEVTTVVNIFLILLDILWLLDILHQISCAYTSQQNGMDVR